MSMSPRKLGLQQSSEALCQFNLRFKRGITAFFLWACAGTFGSTASALEIVKVDWNGHDALGLMGIIEQGDAKAVENALQTMQPLPHGHIVVLLGSPGGSVEEAFKISDLFDDYDVHTVIPSGALCGSACASILFISGNYRTIEHGGLLGQHSCSRGGIPDPQCNERIANLAITKGVNHGSIAAFLKYTPPENVTWFSRSQADCHGLTSYPGSEESNFGVFDNCFLTRVLEMEPKSQPVWRLDFFGDGFRAFQRPGADHDPTAEVSFFCVRGDATNDATRGIYISVDLPMTDEYRSQITRFDLDATGLLLENLPFLMHRLPDGTYRVAGLIPAPDQLPPRTENNPYYTIKIKIDQNESNDTISMVPASGSSLEPLLSFLFSNQGCLSKLPEQ